MSVVETLGHRSVASTHIGLVRKINEDRLLNCARHGLWAVADGMGGHSLGGDAAAAVIRALSGLTDRSSLDRKAIAAALDAANAEIFDTATRTGSTCGSTVAGLYIDGAQGLVFWAGDSRIYRLRAGVLDQLTRDHRLVQELLDAGLLDDRQARTHPRANVITRAIGVGPAPEVEFAVIAVAPGDLYLACSDGLSDLLSAEDIQNALTAPDPADTLVRAALAAGGTDNISTLVIPVAAPDGR